MLTSNVGAFRQKNVKTKELGPVWGEGGAGGMYARDALH